MEDKEDLVEDMLVLEVMTKENPCGMSHTLLTSLKNVVHSFIMKHCIEGASRTQVAKYFGRDVRTLTRWKNEYNDFPKARRSGHKEITYDWYEIIKWKITHSDLFQ